jgi:hypothetical protein
MNKAILKRAAKIYFAQLFNNEKDVDDLWTSL